jgi:CO/xanthine dehydrogenase Mo-binding subunit/aerobic-type carbon monoxide dehydrogenase small subunit (CoxS/CutS family)
MTETIRIEINGEWHELEVERRTTLLEVLHDRLHLTGTKNGCGQGHCGACTVIVASPEPDRRDGKAVRSCVYLARRADGKSVQTIEGLARDGELHPLQRAFVERGAIQCGFCTPGTIMAAKALLDRNPNPTREEIVAALERNLCRCTGYVKIIEAVEAAAAEMRGERARPPSAPQTPLPPLTAVGRPLSQPDARAKATGQARYTADLFFPDMLYAKVLRSAYPHARLRRVDVSRARQLPGVAAVLTAEDVPGEKNHGVIHHDWPVLAYDIVRYVGDAIAIVAAESEAIAEEALKLIEVEYEPLPVISSTEEALAPGAPLIHENREGNILRYTKVRRGDVETGFAKADVIIENTYHTPPGEHAFLEPEAAVAVPDLSPTPLHPPSPPRNGEGKGGRGGWGEVGVTVYVGSQIPFADRRQIAASLALPEDKVRVVHMLTGGAFGGKEDVCAQIHAALLAQATGRPVKLVLTRAESMRVHPKRHATTITLKTGAKRDGRLTAVQVKIVGDTGAYASLGEQVMTRVATHAIGPYDVPHVKVDCYAVHTNNPPAGAFRGFGATQAHFAAESQMDILAEMLGLSPFEVRRRNALRVGGTTATGQVLRESCGLLETIDRVESAMRVAQESKKGVVLPPHVRRGWGVACAYKNVGLGEGLADSAGASVEVTCEGRVIARAGAAEVGQGLAGVVAQIAAEELGVDLSAVEVILGDTHQTLDGGATTASRQTFVTGNAVRHAAQQVRSSLAGAVAEELGIAPDALTFAAGHVSAPDGRSLSLAQTAALAEAEGRSLRVDYVYTPPRTMPLGETGDMHFAYGYATQAAQVEVNTESGEVRVLQVIAAHDVGRAINPLAMEGQVEGGIVMGLGYALLEKFEVEAGIVRSDSLARYKIPNIHHTPKIVTMLVEHPAAEGPFGAKGAGEITSIPTAPAIANAVYHAIGLRSFSLPVKVPRRTG